MDASSRSTAFIVQGSPRFGTAPVCRLDSWLNLFFPWTAVLHCGFPWLPLAREREREREAGHGAHLWGRARRRIEKVQDHLISESLQTRIRFD